MPEALEILTQEEAARLVDMENGRARGDPSRRAIGHRLHRRDRQDRRPRGRPRPRRLARGRAARPAADRRGLDRQHQVRRGAHRPHPVRRRRARFIPRKPSDLIPGVPGPLSDPRRAASARPSEDFIRILTEPENALTRQYVALMETENVHLTFTDDAVAALAEIAAAGQRALGEYRRAPAAYGARAAA